MNRTWGHERQEQISKLPELLSVLVRSPRLRNLDIRTKYSSIDSRTIESDRDKPHLFRLMNLPLENQDRLPPLHALRFSGPDHYDFGPLHCKRWSECMDWSQLQYLDLGLSCPEDFFEQIGGSLRNLKSLTAGIRTGNRRYIHWKYGPMTCRTLEPAKQFILSLAGLHELCVTDLDNATEMIIPVILDAKQPLRKLSYHVSMHRTYEWKERPCTFSISQLDDLHGRFPYLSWLRIDFPLINGKWVSGGPKLVPSLGETPLIRRSHQCTPPLSRASVILLN